MEQGLNYREGDELSWCHPGQIISDKNGVGDECIVLVEMSLTRFEESWTPLKPQHSIPCWLSVQWEPSAWRSCQCCKKKGTSKYCGWICSVYHSWLWDSQHASTGNPVSWSLGHSSRSSCHRRSPEHQELRDLNGSARPSPCFHDNIFLSDLLWASLGQTSRKSSASSVPRE